MFPGMETCPRVQPELEEGYREEFAETRLPCWRGPFKISVGGGEFPVPRLPRVSEENTRNPTRLGESRHHARRANSASTLTVKADFGCETFYLSTSAAENFQATKRTTSMAVSISDKTVEYGDSVTLSAAPKSVSV